MKVLHVLSSNQFSGAENVVCQIIGMFNTEIEMAYCSPNGPIEATLSHAHIKYFPLEKFNKKLLKKIIELYKPDVIHAHDLKASIICSRFYKGLKIVSTIFHHKNPI